MRAGRLRVAFCGVRASCVAAAPSFVSHLCSLVCVRASGRVPAFCGATHGSLSAGSPAPALCIAVAPFFVLHLCSPRVCMCMHARVCWPSPGSRTGGSLRAPAPRPRAPSWHHHSYCIFARSCVCACVRVCMRVPVPAVCPAPHRCIFAGPRAPASCIAAAPSFVLHLCSLLYVYMCACARVCMRVCVCARLRLQLYFTISRSAFIKHACTFFRNLKISYHALAFTLGHFLPQSQAEDERDREPGS